MAPQKCIYISFCANYIPYYNSLNISMAKSFLDELREHLSEVKKPWLYLFLLIIKMAILATLTLFGVYLYTRP